MRPPIKRIDWVVARPVLGAVGLALLLFVAIDAASALTREIDELNTGNYRLGTALQFIALSLPRRAYEFLPFAAVVGVLLGLGALASSAELTAIRAAGMSKLRIAASAMLAVTLVTAPIMWIGEVVAPAAERQGAALVAGAKSRDLIRAGRSGLWAREGDTLLNARRGEVLGNSVNLFDVRLFEFEANGRLARITIAKQAQHAPGIWRLDTVVRQDFAVDRVTTETLPTLDWPSQLEPSLLASGVLRPQYLGMAELTRSIEFMRRNEIDAAIFRSVFWQRAFYPIGVLVLVFACVPFAFGALRSGGMGKRLLLGMVVAIGWYFLQQGVFNFAAAFRVDPRLAQALPAALLALLALAYFWRRR